jgi:hypothetical protein
MVLLILSEYKTYLEVKTNSEMYIDINRGGDKVNYKYNQKKISNFKYLSN